MFKKKDPCNECIKKLEKEVKTKLNKDKSVDREMRTILYEQLDYILDDLRKEHNNVKTEIVSLINHHKKEKNKLTSKSFDTLHQEYNPYKKTQYEIDMLDALNANQSRDPEDIEEDIFKASAYPRRLTAKQKIATAKKRVDKSKSLRKTKRLSQSAREAGIKKVKDGYLITPKTQYRYSAPGNNTSDDFEPKPKKKGFFENLFGKGGRKTRRKRKRTRKKRKKRRRKTRK